MILSGFAPSRISLAGGGSDTPEYAALYGGLTLSFAIDLYSEATMFSGNDLSMFQGSTSGHYFPDKANPEFYYTILQEFGLNNSTHTTRLNCNYQGEITGGLGSSAAAAVLLVALCNKRLNLGMSPTEIAERAWQIETKKLGLYGGRQDQYCTSVGGFNLIEYRDDYVQVHQLDEALLEPLLPSLMLIHTGANRRSKKIQENLKGLSTFQKKALDQIKESVTTGLKLLTEQDIPGFGQLMNDMWEQKKRSNRSASTPRIDTICEASLRNGAYGFRISGSGGGGYAVLVYNPKKKEALERVLTSQELGCSIVPFKVDTAGVRVTEIC